MLALGVIRLGRPQDVDFAARVAEACYQMYHTSPSGISPDNAEVMETADGSVVITPGSEFTCRSVYRKDGLRTMLANSGSRR